MTDSVRARLVFASSVVFLVAVFVFLSPELKNVSRETFASETATTAQVYRGFDLPMRMRFDGRQLQHADLRLLGADAPRDRRHDCQGNEPRADNRLLSASSTAKKFCPRRPPRASTCSRGRCPSSRSFSAAALMVIAVGRWRSNPPPAQADSKPERGAGVIRPRTQAQTRKRTRGAQVTGVHPSPPR